MKKDIKAIRVEVPTELYKKFKEQLNKDYKTTTSFIKETIVEYIRKGENKIKT